MPLSKNELSIEPIWAKLYTELWIEDGLSYVTSVISTPLYLDEYIKFNSRLEQTK